MTQSLKSRNQGMAWWVLGLSQPRTWEESSMARLPTLEGKKTAHLEMQKSRLPLRNKTPFLIRQSHKMRRWSYGFWFLFDEESWRRQGENHQPPPTMKQVLKE